MRIGIDGLPLEVTSNGGISRYVFIKIVYRYW
jgi:hypothetical protein